MRHAFLIIAHHEPQLLATLISLLDRPGSDIYIHIDRNADINEFRHIRCKHSEVKFVENRIKVRWGTYSQIETELILFEAAHKGGYEYYHLLSGVDLPIKPMDEIMEFFERNKGHEFLGSRRTDERHTERAKYYHFFISRHKNLLAKVCIWLQKLSGTDRVKGEHELWFGNNWGSLSHEFVEKLLDGREWIERYFRHSLCGDEIYKQTYMHKTGFHERDHGPIRMIDWNRGNPYTFREGDLEILMNSDRLFCRKFSSEESSMKLVEQVIEKIR